MISKAQAERFTPDKATFQFNSDTYYVCIDCRTGEVTYGSEQARKRAEQLRPLMDAFYNLLRTIPHPE